MSSLDQLCAAACTTGLDGPGGQHTSEIRVIEVDAYASVADLIHAAIAANGGAATLKEIYEVCERNGRIAYRRADGSRLITTNDHWKSQVRHALYTGGRFERVPGNGEFWRLSQPYRGAAAELIKVLVRADDETADVRASVALPPSSGRALPEATATAGPQPLRSSGTGRQRRKRSAPPASGEIGAGNEATCDSVNHATSGVPLRTSARRQRTAATETGPPDNLSTLDEEDEVKELPRLRRGNRATPWRGNVNGTPFVDGAAHNYSFADEQRSSGLPHTSRDSEDPSTLRWGCTGLRSTYIIAAESSLSAGRTPAVPRTALARGRAGSAEADSAVPGFQHWLGKGHKAHDAADFSAPPAKRQAQESPRMTTLPTPPSCQDPAAQLTPPFMAQWTEMFKQMHDAAVAQQKAAAGASSVDDSTPGHSPCPSLAYLPGLLAAAAPFMATQQVQHELQKQMEAIFLGSNGMGAPANRQ